MSSVAWGLARAVAFLAYYSGGLWLFERAARGCRARPRCTVLMYHRIASEPVGYRDIQVTPETFASHLDYLLTRGYDLLSLGEYQDYLEGRRDLTRDAVIITFDDGYRDNYTNALPLLNETGIAAAVFLCVGPIEGGPPLWWDRVAASVRAIRVAGVAPSCDGGDSLPSPVFAELRRAMSAGEARASRCVARIVDFVKGLGEEQRAAVVEELERISGAQSDGELMLTWDMVREMELAGVSFGAHTVTHPVLAQLPGDAAHCEIVASKHVMEEQLGHPVTSFAYPYGKTALIGCLSSEIVRDAGFAWAYTTENGTNRLGDDPLLLRRNGIRDVPVYMFAARVSGMFESGVFALIRDALARCARHPA